MSVEGQPLWSDGAHGGRFVIVTDEISLDTERAFVNLLKGAGCSWLKWLSNTWLVSVDSAGCDPEEAIISFLVKCEAKYLVLRVSPLSWSFGCPNVVASKWRRWLDRNWST